MELDPTDRLGVLECLARYGRLIDARDWPALADVFTPDATFDLTEIGGAVLSGLDQIRDYMAHRARHPVAHHVTNAHIENADGSCVRTTCMLIAVQGDGSVASGLYADEFVRSGHALRIRRRAFRWLLAPQTKAT
jgi:SnoaL-like domain